MSLVNKLLSPLRLLPGTRSLLRSTHYVALEEQAAHFHASFPTPSDQSAISYLSTDRVRLRFRYSNRSTAALSREHRPRPPAHAPRSSSTSVARARRSSLIPSPLHPRQAPDDSVRACAIELRALHHKRF